MNKSESKYFSTAVKMDEAFLSLLEKKDFAYITVKEICEAAGVNRSTFYLHYETMSDLLSESVEHMNAQFLSHMDMNAANFIEKMHSRTIEEFYLITPEYLIPYLGYIKENKRLFRTVMENAAVLGMEKSYERMYCHVLNPIMDYYKVPDKDKNYLLAFYIQGIMAIISEWLRNDCSDSVDYVVNIIRKCVKRPEENQ